MKWIGLIFCILALLLNNYSKGEEIIIEIPNYLEASQKEHFEDILEKRLVYFFQDENIDIKKEKNYIIINTNRNSPKNFKKDLLNNFDFKIYTIEKKISENVFRFINITKQNVVETLLLSKVPIVNQKDIKELAIKIDKSEAIFSIIFSQNTMLVNKEKFGKIIRSGERICIVINNKYSTAPILLGAPPERFSLEINEEESKIIQMQYKYPFL